MKPLKTLIFNNFIISSCWGYVVMHNHSDLIHLYYDSSALPIDPSGIGVFARVDIPIDELICEFRGEVIDIDSLTDADITNLSNKVIYSERYDGMSFAVDANNICAYVNDCASIVGSTYSRKDLKEFKIHNNIPPYFGYSYNAKTYKTKLGKIFLKSISHIKRNSEIYFPYGM